jgi:hypothetical protein
MDKCMFSIRWIAGMKKGSKLLFLSMRNEEAYDSCVYSCWSIEQDVFISSNLMYLETVNSDSVFIRTEESSGSIFKIVLQGYLKSRHRSTI